MRWVASIAFALACVSSGIAPASADQGSYPESEDAKDAAFGSLNWQLGSGTYQLPRSHAVIKLRNGYGLLLGADAQRYSWLVSGTEFPDTEAVIAYDSGGSAEVYYEWRDEGFVSDSDWNEIDPDALLQIYRDGTEAGNDERIDNGMLPMEVVGWLEVPYYNKKTRTVTYAIQLKDAKGSWVNAFALRLGRKGYTEFTWVGPVSAFKGAGGRPSLLNQALTTHSFEKGHRYSDYAEGDQIASYAIAGLVAASMGKKFGKGLFAGLLAILLASKKAAVAVVGAIGALLIQLGRRVLGGARPADADS